MSKVSPDLIHVYLLGFTCFSTVTGEPFDDPSGRWRLGGGVQVPIEVTIAAEKNKIIKLKILDTLTYPIKLSILLGLINSLRVQNIT